MDGASTIQPEVWTDFCAEYGGAVFTAQSLEKNLATFLTFHEARKRSVVRRPTPQEIIQLIDDIDGNAIGELLKRIRELQVLSPTEEQLLERANKNRQILIHHFLLGHPDMFETTGGMEKARDEVQLLLEPITEANRLSQELVEKEIARMKN